MLATTYSTASGVIERLLTCFDGLHMTGVLGVRSPLLLARSITFSKHQML